MNNFDFGEKKYQILIFAILFVFFLLIIHAFQIMPTSLPNSTTIENSYDKNLSINNVQEESISTEHKIQYADNNEEYEEDEKIEDRNIANKPIDDNELFTVIEDDQNFDQITTNLQRETENNSNTSNADTVALSLFEADKKLNEKNLDDALSLYTSISEKTNEDYVKQRCYEGIAYVYAKNKKYGSAILYAQKAYNIEPTDSVRVLLARLYYKTGYIDKATKIITSVLKNEFN